MKLTGMLGGRAWTLVVSAAALLASLTLVSAPVGAPRAAAAALTPVSTPAPSADKDKVYLKDGRVLEGKITKELDGYVWLLQDTNGISHEEFLKPGDIDKIVRAGDGATPADETKPETKPDAKGEAKPKPGPGDTPRAAILTAEEMVGMQMAAKPLKDAIPLLEKDGVNVVVIKVKSGGGFLLEIQRISDVIHKEYKQKFRTVAWIESAISAAAMSSHCLEEIYFMPNGNYGACTGWSGALQAMKGRGLEATLLMMEEISARGGHPKEIMRAMQISGRDEVLSELEIEPPSGKLSADIDPVTGKVTWYQDHSGKHILNPLANIDILTFSAPDAERFKFSRGTAATKEELAKLMGYQEIEWVGKPKKGYAWPVSDAEEMQIKWRADITEAQARLNEYFQKYGVAVQTAQSMQNRADRAAWVAKARGALDFLRQLVKRFPNIGFLQGIDDNWFRDQEELLRQLLK
ncbi:MAG: hypothetical protein IT434_17390 [Phycisphaerales bacterium]|nr:hypothetical protein [Phycisphaerales bacterium]